MSLYKFKYENNRKQGNLNKYHCATGFDVRKQKNKINK